jgi:RHS repeat-associated protein
MQEVFMGNLRGFSAGIAGVAALLSVGPVLGQNQGQINYANGYGFINDEGIAEYRPYAPAPKPPRKPAPRPHVPGIYPHGFGFINSRGAAEYQPYAWQNLDGAVLPKSNDQNPSGEYLSGTNPFSALTFPGDPLGATIFVANPLTIGRVSCGNGPLGSSGQDTCAGSSTQTVAGVVETNITTLTKDANGKISSIGLTSLANGTTTRILNPSQPVTPQIPEVASSFGSQAGTVDPISTATGGLDSGPFLDLSLGGPLPLVLRRFYYSGLGAGFGQNAIGYNWITNFDPYLGISGNVAIVALEGGGSVAFRLNGSTYQTIYTPRLAYQFVKDTTRYRFLNPQNNLIYDFDFNGFLTQVEDRNGNALTISRGTLGPTQVSDGLGRTLSFTYVIAGSQPNLTKVQDQSGRSVSFSQDSNFNLTSMTDANGNTTTYSYIGSLLSKTVRPRGNAPYTQTFDPVSGAATGQTDSEGNTTTLSYVAGGKPGVTVMSDPLGRTTTFNYSAATLVDLSSLKDAAGNTSSMGYDTAGRPTSFTDRLGNKTSVTYDAASGYPASFTDALGNTTSYAYQSQVQGDFTFYNLVKTSYPDGTSEAFAYDASGNVLTATDRAGKQTTYTYNSRGQVLAETNAAGGVTTVTYNADATMASVKIPSGDVTTYSYDNLKRLAKIQNADNTTMSFTRDALDQILTVTDERGNVIKLGYDANNNLHSMTDALSKTATISYDTDDLVHSIADRLGNSTTYQYDPFGSATAVTDAAGEKTTYAYDDLERLQSATDPAGKSMSFTYDAEGRLASVTDALGDTARIQVDGNRRPTQLTSPLGEATSFAYDPLDRITSQTDALGRRSSFSYESRGLPSVIASPGGITASFAWGNLPLLSSVTDPDGNVWPITRDTLGRVTASTDPLGQALKYTYDSRSRISSVTSPVDSAQLAYDAAGNLTQTQYSDNTSLSYAYDADNRLTGGTGFSLSYDANGRMIGSNGLSIARDPVGRISSITYAAGKTVTYAYDSRGLLSKVADWTGGSVAFTFDDAHRLVSEARSNGLSTQYTYDKDGRIASITDGAGTKTLASIAVSRDAIGRVTSSTRTIPQEAAPSGPSTSSLTFDAANQISGMTYDSRGRLTDDNAGATYHWSASSRLLSYARPDGSASATYDGLGQRISRSAPQHAAQNYVLNYATLIPSVATIQSGGSDQSYYVYTPGGSLLYSINAAGNTHHYYSFDDTGSTIFLTDDTGAITDAYGISPYGDVVTAGPSNSTDNPFTWQGQFGVMEDPGTRLYYARFRYYDSATARFLSRDPLFSPAPRKVNPYQYAAGNPVANGDPMGLKTSNLPPNSFVTYDDPGLFFSGTGRTPLLSVNELNKWAQKNPLFVVGGQVYEAPELKKLFLAMFIGVMDGGGMATVDPPSFEPDDYPTPPVHSIVGDLTPVIIP